uniref:Uncharacterized protein n=1 Tax=viral metagenome TaxID=1070528 RepID=A0A6M3JMQ6_9ZZZZ
MKRIFRPTTKYIGNTGVERSVVKWIWTKGHGLKVYFKNGESYKSEYKSIKELKNCEKSIEEVVI